MISGFTTYVRPEVSHLIYNRILQELCELIRSRGRQEFYSFPSVAVFDDERNGFR